ncbi:aminotransferase class V-fold PLP-dependent enzyme [Stieleria sp. JC731]|uniref:aminotransferase class V-fold PLP-dependent enzyme n=1 Tax=Pirellulaceae TaxID=2691357 RepID=UPI001E43CB5A|nr:aminotransferase class V-fold PLP-dependent enzyme [Stieleria sp. JC731]MCC9599033.1 aminotransferase class V-fold PLP-dependent enzyme [Stieleria sp. JC731]
MRQHWQLNPEIDYLNHGSFGATPTTVLQARIGYIEQLERDPIEFLAPERDLEPKLDHVRAVVSDLVGCEDESLVFVRNATDGVNAVVRSLKLQPGDEIVITNHGYNACNNAIRFAAETIGAVVRVAQIPFPLQHEDDVIQSVAAVLTERTRLLVVDHVTSPTAIVFPLERLVELAHENKTRILVDGAHAPGMIPIDLRQLGADYYTANHHKWICAPKASGFLYVDKSLHQEVRPTVISHGANKQSDRRSRFHAEFDWPGTYDVTPILAVPAALDFLGTLFPGGLPQLMDRNHDCAIQARKIMNDALGAEAATPEPMVGSMAAVTLAKDKFSSSSDLATFQKHLFDKHRIEVPTFMGPNDTPILRVSMQAYNDLAQVERLADLLRTSI